MVLKEKIYSPINGELVQIENVNDPVFSEKMIGDGLAIRPKEKVLTVIYAPCDGEVQTLHDSLHAVALKTQEGVEILIHVGIDTVSLKGEGFKSLIKQGDIVKKGDKLLEVDFLAIEEKVPSLDVIVLITNLKEDQGLKKKDSKEVELQEEIFTILEGDLHEEEKEEEVSGNIISSGKLQVINKMGIHARPASTIFQVASKYKSDIKIKKGDSEINAKSIVAILGLAIKFQEKIEILASGIDAKEAVDELKESIEKGLGETGDHIAPIINEEKKESKQEQVRDFSKPLDLEGVVASPGLVIGKSFLIEEEIIDYNEEAQDKEQELNSLKKAIENVKDLIIVDIEKAKEEAHKVKVEIFSAHLNLIDDPALFEDAKNYIVRGKSACYAWEKAIANSIEVLNTTGNKLLMERCADLKDMGKRVIYAILGIVHSNSLDLKGDSIVIASDLVPSDLSKFDDKVKGVILARGSATSHVSLMLRNMGVATLVAVGESVLNIKNETNIILDATEGIVSVNPLEETLQGIKDKKEKLDKIREENITNAKLDSITKDGVKITVKGNVSNAEEARKAFELGANGIGLLRSEFLFFSTSKAPSVEEQKSLYQDVVDAMQGGSVTLRTLDVGGDKPLQYVHIQHEENPIMGVRGIRNYKDNLDVFLNQIRAIFKIKPLILCKVMLPMISEVEEFIEIKKIIEEEAEKEGVKDKIELGTMIEVPSMALIADKIAKYVDFFSIGTNDLAQYTMAMDRGNPKLTGRLNNLNPALLKLIKMTVEGGNKHNIPTAVCGAMASEIKAVPILIGLGVKELSTSMRSIPDVKALIRTLDTKKCIEVANLALDMETTEDVINLVVKEFKL